MVSRRSSEIPDLLQPEPTLRIAAERTKTAMTLAFAGGATGALFSEALEDARLAPSSFDPGCFASDLFLSRFVSGCFRARIGGEEPVLCTSYLVRLLAQPPSELTTVEFRRAILAELVENEDLAARLKKLYAALCQLRGLIENAGGERNWDPNRRQMDILRALKEAIDGMAEGFASASSGLKRLADFGSRVQGGEPYRSLSDLIRYDSEMANLSLNVGVGADGRIRGFEIVSIEQDAENPFTSSAWRRWLTKVELYLRGYRFSDGEVMARLIDAVFTGVEDEAVVLVQLLGDLEFYLGALGFRDRAHEANLEVCLPELVDADSPRRLEKLFNPLLMMAGITPIPCDLNTERHASTVLVTGPNSGGKTRLLQSLGFAQLLAQSGLFIPARSGAIALVPALVVSLIEEVRADQAEGRLGMELIRIRGLFEELPPGAMVLLDELCSGTNPSEGEEIFELVVTTLAGLEPQVFITTHFLAFAARLCRERKIPNMGFLQVELDAERNATFQFVEGVAESSLAGHAAARLGVTRDQLASLVAKNVQRHRARAHSDVDPA